MLHAVCLWLLLPLDASPCKEKEDSPTVDP